MGQEIKIRSKPDKSGNPSSEPWEFYEIGTIFFNPEFSRKIQKSKKSLTKNLSFFERFSLTHSGGSSVSLGTIINSSRTNPRFGPSFK